MPSDPWKSKRPVKLLLTVTPASELPIEMPATSRSSVFPEMGEMAVVSPLVVVVASLKFDAVPSKPLFGKLVAMPLYSKICSARWALVRGAVATVTD